MAGSIESKANRERKQASRTPTGPVPRVIHQTWKHAHLRWPLSACAASFGKWNPDWEYQLWTDEECETLIREELPDFYPTYMQHPKGIFRADIFRVALLYLRGGVYADLDVECLRPLQDLLTAVDGDDWEVLLARDHPAHERAHYNGRAMWMNAFMVAKPGSRFFRAVLERYGANLTQGRPFGDVVQQTGPGLFSTVVENSMVGPLGLGIRPLPWRWIHPLPNVFVSFPEQPQYVEIILKRTWKEGAQVWLGDDDEGDPAKGGPPFVAHYWWHSYIEGCRMVNMLLKHADVLLQTDGEIVERRLQSWVRHLGTSLDAAGQALAQTAERGQQGACVVVGEPMIWGESIQLPFLDLASQVFAGLPVKLLPVHEFPTKANGSSSTSSEGAISLLVVSSDDPVSALNSLKRCIGSGTLARGGTVLVLGKNRKTAGQLAKVLKAAGWHSECQTGGWLWKDAFAPSHPIPQIIHFFRADNTATETEIELSISSWKRHHARWDSRKWGVAEIRALIESEVADFLDTFLSYPTESMRLAAGRYLVLRKHGGVAVTSGTLCLAPLDTLCSGTSAWMGIASYRSVDRKETPVLGDHVIASEASHPVWQQVEQDLEMQAHGASNDAVGADFLTRRILDAGRWVARARCPKLFGVEVFNPGEIPPEQWPADISSLTEEFVRSQFPLTYALPIRTLPAAIRSRLMRAADVAQDGKPVLT